MHCKSITPSKIFLTIPETVYNFLGGWGLQKKKPPLPPEEKSLHPSGIANSKLNSISNTLLPT